MLRSLDIRDILIIDRLELDFQPGLNVLTGETGAGKSILLDSLGFVLGWRGRADLVREGAKSGEVTAVFDLAADHPARQVLQDAGIPMDDELILRRTNAADGRKTARVNDRRVSAEVLRTLSDSLVELHGQQDDRGLLNAATHRIILDDYGRLQGDLDDVSQAWKEWRKSQDELDKAQKEFEILRAEEEFLRHAVSEFDVLDPQPGEEATLDTSRRLMQAAGRIRDDIAKANSALGDQGAEGSITDATRWLEEVADAAQGRLDTALEALGRALAELGDAQQGVQDCLRELSFDSNELEQCEERLFAIRALARKHECAADDLADFAQGLRGRLAALERGGEDLKTLSQAVNKAEEKYNACATSLSKKRGKAAKNLDRDMTGQLAPLKMERAVFSTDLEAHEPGPGGRDRVQFTVATNPGAPSGALNKIASGGELSRLLLALKVCLSANSTGMTMIFDEIDRGVGGATADAVGRRLAEIATDGQVLVVTHSPQVAARAGHHWRVEKIVKSGKTLSGVHALDVAEREDELARMLAGDTITHQARAAARALLEG